ncbi:MAG: hypothetical protein JF587_18765 [Catenulisporales bacterium]|nr:hypothetical protein [Catenulisporales bacterium]
MSSQVSDFVLERVRQWGVHRIFGYPGDGINGLLGAFGRAEGDPEFIQARHEEMAAFMACGHAKFTGEVGCCVATSGPGAIHLLNGLYDAKLDHQPVVAIVGQQRRSSLGAQYQQEVKLEQLFDDVSEYCQVVMHPAQARHVIDRAFKTALTRRGVATVIIPEDVQEEEAVPSPPRMHGAVYSSVGWSRPRMLPEETELHKAAAVLNEGQKVAILIGQGAADAVDEVIETAELLGAGVAKALLGRAVLPDDLPFVTGPIGLLGSKPSDRMMQECDTLLMVGTSFPYAEWLPEEGQARGVEIDIDGSMIGMRYPMEAHLVGDAKETLRALIPLLTRKTDRSWREGIENDVRHWQRVMTRRSDQDFGHEINPQSVLAELSARLPAHAILTADSGSGTNWWARRAVRDRGPVRLSGPPGDRRGRRRGVPDERDERDDHGQAVPGPADRRHAVRVLRAEQPGPEPGHLGAAGPRRRPEVRGLAAHPGRAVCALRRVGRARGGVLRRSQGRRSGVGRGVGQPAAGGAGVQGRSRDRADPAARDVGADLGYGQGVGARSGAG